MTKQILSLSNVVTEEVIRMNLTKDEIAERKDQISKELMATQDLEQQLSDLKKSYSDRIKAKRIEIRKNLHEVRMGFVDKLMTVHNIPNDKNMTIEFFDDAGTLVGTRMMTREERPSIQFQPQD